MLWAEQRRFQINYKIMGGLIRSVVPRSSVIFVVISVAAVASLFLERRSKGNYTVVQRDRERRREKTFSSTARPRRRKTGSATTKGTKIRRARDGRDDDGGWNVRPELSEKATMRDTLLPDQLPSFLSPSAHSLPLSFSLSLSVSLRLFRSHPPVLEVSQLSSCGRNFV